MVKEFPRAPEVQHTLGELALARGKRSYDKRQDLAKRDADREIARELSDRLRGRRRRPRGPK